MAREEGVKWGVMVKEAEGVKVPDNMVWSGRLKRTTSLELWLQLLVFRTLVGAIFRAEFIHEHHRLRRYD